LHRDGERTTNHAKEWNDANRPWYSGVTGYQWLVLVIASLGWIFDAFEGQVYIASMSQATPVLLKNSPHISEGFVKNLALGAFLIGGAVGGLAFGVLSDRVGRVKTMMLTILFYSAFTCLSAFSQEWWHMVLLRFFVALGVGGEWAVASAMVAEVFPKHARSNSLGIFHASSLLGIWAAVAVGTWIVGNPWFGPADWRWRWAFGIGVLPALLTLWVYASLREPEQWVQARALAAADRSRRTGRLLDLFHRDLVRSTLVGLTLAAVGLATFWGVYAQAPTLMRELAENARLGPPAATLTLDQRREALGALPEEINTSLQRSEMLALFLISIGGGIGGLCFAPLANRVGRRGAFLFFCLGGTAAAPLVFKVLPLGPGWLLWSSLPLFGLLVNGMHAGYAVYFPELFPTRLRGTGGGFCFNGGRLLAAGVLLLNALMRNRGISLADSGAILGALFLLGVVVLCFAPETRGRELPE
jgi:MFS family permease